MLKLCGTAPKSTLHHGELIGEFIPSRDRKGEAMPQTRFTILSDYFLKRIPTCVADDFWVS